MSTEKNFTERTLERIRSGEGSDSSRKKRKFSRILLVIDAVLVLALLGYFTNREKQPTYRAVKFHYGDIEFRFSAARDGSGDYLFTLSARKPEKIKREIMFNGSIATLVLTHGNTIIAQKTMAAGSRRIDFEGNAVRTYIVPVEDDILKNFADSHRDSIKNERKTLISFVKPTIPMKAVLTLNTGEKISTELDVPYEVSGEK